MASKRSKAILEPRFIEVLLSEIELPDYNPREIKERDFKRLCDDIKADPNFLIQRPPLVNYITAEHRYVCYAGNQRCKAATANGNTHIHVWVEDDVPKKVQDERMIKDNLHRGQWDMEKLAEWDFDLLKDLGLGSKDLLELGKANDREAAKVSLQEKFVAPPFSVLDTRQGYWQERKRTWFDAGIESTESREEMEVSGSLSGSVPGYYKKKNQLEKARGKKMSNEEFERDFLPDLMLEDSTLSYTKSGGLLSTFDPVLCEVLYNWFCPKGGAILDPFAGGSVRGIVAGFMGLEYLGIDLRKEQVLANKKQLKTFDMKNVHWMEGDSNNLPVMIQDDILFDFVFSCPPYFDLEKYSKDEADLSNMSDESFIRVYQSIIAKSVTKLKDNRFACFVVGNARNKAGFVRDLQAETVAAFEAAGAMYYNEIVLLNVAGSTPIRVGRQFEKGRKVGKVHQNVLVFYKGDPKQIEKLEWLINVDEALDGQPYQPIVASPTTTSE